MSGILIVEDELKIAKFLQLELEHEGFTTGYAANGRQALEVFAKGSWDLVLLDIMIPELNGIEVLRRIRKTSSLPVIILTAKGETPDKVNGLDAGADDYITKPFAIEELLARIRSLLRRTNNSNASNEDSENEKPIIFKELELDPNRVEVKMRNDFISLTRTEFLLLQCLMINKNHVLSREEIIKQVWGPSHYIDDNSVDVYIRYLRSKIDDFYNVSYISTVRGAGYSMKD